MWRRFPVPIALLLFISVAIIWAVVALKSYTVGGHQRSVTQSLADWKTEFSTIESQHDAVRTAEMLDYVQGYYIPGEGYRSTSRIEDALQSQRQDTIDAFVAALRKYTNEDFGTDSTKWLTHLETSIPDEGRSPKEVTHN